MVGESAGGSPGKRAVRGPAEDEKPAVRDRILAGARQMFARKGFRASVKDIAQAAGLVAPSLIFWYFEDKESLLLEATTTMSPLHQVTRVLDEAGEADVLTMLARVADRYLEVYQDSLNRRILLQLVGSAPQQPRVQGLLRRQLTEATVGRMAELMRRGQAEGSVRRDLEPEWLAQSFLGVLYALVTRWEVDEGLPWDAPAIRRQLLELVQGPGFRPQHP
ncbi:TetR/AcrR family transcriptional regulator [Candidatus Hydrogenisulfobacillus filiaventi]|uniref:TetR/AcrR family transcriptional regulator n=1 Tax=Candidatus Hydrogenisulfobacillus filiaventi TaxID=2707344 RepID=A0A6F8ZFQ3_9FIRM|nr:TetR/AcrR family transcriptional regulator [Bacillota bacterium]CAB1128292.1 TetR/AcrR family transcriptional regulator [Candidatus Hydrogenisulfobacillus filiaventi]